MKPGFKVGQFILERPIGEGGMAEVWLGRNTLLGTPVAVKFLNQQFASRQDIEQRFLNEGKRQGVLDHPNIVKVFTFDYVGTQSFLVLQYIEGEPLDVRLQRGRMSRQEILEVSKGVLSGLGYAHSAGVVHRDVKPSNILLDRAGHPYLGDFGIVLAVNEKRVTTAGTSMGTPHYMSPEQILRPMDVDQRADIYSFGCVLYEMLTGRVPFDAAGTAGNTDFTVKMAHVNDAPTPPRSFNPAIQPAVEAVVMRCLSKDPAQRYSHCGEVRDALTRAMALTEVEPRLVVDPVPPAPHKLWWMLGAAGVVLAAALAWVLPTSPTPEVVYFRATPSTVKMGESVTLSWQVKNAKEVNLPDVGIQPSTGSVTMNPESTKSYELIASNGGKKVSSYAIATVSGKVPLLGEAVIQNYEMSPATAAPNDPVVIRWDVQNASDVDINGTKEPATGRTTVHMDHSTNYTLHGHGTNGKEFEKVLSLTIVPTGSASHGTGKAPNPPVVAPEITSLTVTPETVRPGQSIEVRWAVRNAQKVYLGKGEVSPAGSQTFTIQTTSTAVITAEGADGKRVTRSATATVIPAQQPPVTPLAIRQFSSQRSFVTQPGQPVMLTYSLSGATQAIIDPNPGRITGSLESGRVTVFPQATTRYVLTAYSATGEMLQREIIVVVPSVDTRPDPPVIDPDPRPNPRPNPGPARNGWNVTHSHTAAKVPLSIVNGSNPLPPCHGFLSVANGAIHFRSIDSNDSFDAPFSEVEEVSENRSPIGNQRAFHVKLHSRNYNFIPEQSPQMIVGTIHQAMER